MATERWQQIEQLYHAALEHAPERRAAFLAEVCADDADLRREVEDLLRYDGEAETFMQDNAAVVVAYQLDSEVLEDTQTLITGQQLGAYKILAPLGKGGMGEVHLAFDTRLERKVALKLLPRDVATNKERLHRFVREAKAASALNHPHVATVYDIGAADGVSFIAMEYVEGQTLAAKINGAPLPINEVVAIGSQIADALDEAHTKGITHRDLKPANVMLTSRDQVKVLDFGLAKIARPPSIDSNVSTLAKTASGVVMGTVPYMSPEQALGRDVDHRSDIFSLGVVLYEMAAGRLPFAGANTAETLDRILHAEPEFTTGTPAALERIVLRCLEKDRDARYQAAAEVMTALQALPTNNQAVYQTEESAEELAATRQMKAVTTSETKAGGTRLIGRRGMGGAVLAVVLLLGLGAFLYWRRTPALPPDQIKSLAVLPLENLSGDPAQEYFADGMTDALISNLSQVRALRVISRTSVMRFKGSRKPLAEIARDLNVEAVIEGSVQRDGGRVKITARLIRTADETLLRSFDYDRELADVLKLQSEVARVVAGEIRTQVTAEEQARLAGAQRVKPEAHEAYLLGRYHARRQNEAELKLAIGHFERAVQLDDGYAAAWAGLSLAWQQRGIFGAIPFQDVAQPAREAAVKALAADANSAEGYTALAIFKNRYEWDWAGSEHDFRRAIELNPGSVEAHRFFAHLLSALGRNDGALSEIQAAEKLDPLSSLVQSDFGINLYRARKYEQAEQRLKRALALDPLNHGVYARLGNVYEEMGRNAEALANHEKALALQRGSVRDGINLANIALIHARMGRRADALRLLKEVGRTTTPAQFPRQNVANVWAALANLDEAFRLMFELLEKRNTLLIFLKVDPKTASLHSDPRWQELLRPLNFPAE